MMEEEDVIGTWDLPFAAEPSLDFESSVAQVLIVPAEPGTSPRLEARGRAARRLQPSVKLDGGVTRVRIAGWDELGFPGDLWGFAGKVKYALHVPRAAAAKVRTEAGRIRVRDLEGCDLSLETDAGTIDLERVHGRLKIRTAAGKIDGEDVGGTFDVETNAGAIRLRVLGLDAGTHRVRTDLGSVRIELARGILARIDAHTSLGSTRIDYPSTTRAAALLEISNEVGSVRVREWSRRRAAEAAPSSGPYRTPAAPIVVAAEVVPPDAEVPGAPKADPLDRVLEMVAQGKLSPRDAGEILRQLGHV